MLKWLKESPSLKKIPVIVLTTSGAQEDIDESYRIGANSFFVKPLEFEGFKKTFELICHYWFREVRLPEKTGPPSLQPTAAFPPIGHG